jgi:hypothetical protein
MRFDHVMKLILQRSTETTKHVEWECVQAKQSLTCPWIVYKPKQVWCVFRWCTIKILRLKKLNQLVYP